MYFLASSRRFIDVIGSLGHQAKPENETMVNLLRPQDLQKISSDAEMEEMDKERLIKQKAKQQEAELREAFMSQDVHPEAIERINNAVSNAAKNGFSQLQVVTFPASFCNDGGRRINTLDPDWPASLEGFAKRAFEFYVKELRPLGYKLHAEIISFPGGMPGEVGFFLKW